MNAYRHHWNKGFGFLRASSTTDKRELHPSLVRHDKCPSSMISESMFEGTLCFHPVWTVSSSKWAMSRHSVKPLGSWGSSLKAFALMSWQEVRKTPGRPIVNQD